MRIKTTTILATMLLLMTFVACKKEAKNCDTSTALQCTSSAAKIPLIIDLQGGFDNDCVEIKIDNQVVYHCTVKTNELTGLAQRLTLEYCAGTPNLEIKIGNKTYTSQSFTLNSTLYLGINLDKSHKTATVQTSSTPFLYE